MTSSGMHGILMTAVRVRPGTAEAGRSVTVGACVRSQPDPEPWRTGGGSRHPHGRHVASLRRSAGATWRVSREAGVRHSGENTTGSRPVLEGAQAVTGLTPCVPKAFRRLPQPFMGGRVRARCHDLMFSSNELWSSKVRHVGAHPVVAPSAAGSSLIADRGPPSLVAHGRSCQDARPPRPGAPRGTGPIIRHDRATVSGNCVTHY